MGSGWFRTDEQMSLIELLERLALEGQVEQARWLLARLPEDAPLDWRNLAVALTLRLADRVPQGATVVGIGGGQGAGKTTLSRLLVTALDAAELAAVSLSLDDFYLSRAQRRSLSEQVHPLLSTRGVPGTHEVDRACRVLETLKSRGACRLPLFDKAADERRPPAAEPLAGPGLDVVIFEGWCVGAPAQPAARLVEPVNQLERREDPDGRWRRFVNDRLAADYARLWALIDELLYLQVPGVESVIRWRTEQEQAHPPAQRMDAAALARFVAHYERLTRWMLETLPGHADLVGVLDENHRLIDLIRS